LHYFPETSLTTPGLASDTPRGRYGDTPRWEPMQYAIMTVGAVTASKGLQMCSTSHVAALSVRIAVGRLRHGVDYSGR